MRKSKIIKKLKKDIIKEVKRIYYTIQNENNNDNYDYRTMYFNRRVYTEKYISLFKHEKGNWIIEIDDYTVTPFSPFRGIEYNDEEIYIIKSEPFKYKDSIDLLVNYKDILKHQVDMILEELKWEIN